MSYNSIAALANDNDFALRVSACASTEHVPGDPQIWMADHRWEMAAMPGFGDAYASAVQGGIGRPGAAEDVITDAMILSAVQSLTVEP